MHVDGILDNPDPAHLIQRVFILDGNVKIIDNIPIAEARRHVSYTNATCLQVAAGALAAMIWAIRHPHEGLREADQLDFRECLDVARPYLGTLVGAYTDWTPLQGRGELFSEHLDSDHPWLLQNVRARQWPA